MKESICVLTPRASRGLLLCFVFALLQGSAVTALADSGKVDGWCNVIEKSIERNEEDSRKAHDSAQTERLRDARRKLEQDAHNRGCPGH
jgi:hypothetical protein